MLGSSMFSECKNLKSVTMTDSVKEISGAFWSCPNLERITIPKTIEKIWCDSFRECNKLIDENGFMISNGVLYGYVGPGGHVVVPEGVTKIIGAFSWCDELTSVKLPDSLTEIGNEAFYYCDNLEDINIPNSVNSFGRKAFNGCYQLADDNGFVIVGDIIFDYYGDSEDLVIPDGITRIDDNAFDSCYYLEHVTIPGSVKSIGEYAFKGCDYLESVEMLYGVEEIGDYAFAWCESLADVQLPESLIIIGCRAFSDLPSLTEITIPASVETICTYAFDDCENLENVTILNDDIEIRPMAFWHCKSLADEDGFVIVNDVLYYYYGNETNVVIPDGVVELDGTFSYNESIRSVTLPDSVRIIGPQAFWNCTSLRNINIPDSVTIIGEFAFQSCTSLTTVVLPDSLTELRRYAFSYCENLTSITIPNSVTTINMQALYHCGLNSVRIPSSVTCLDMCALGSERKTASDGFIPVIRFSGTKKEWDALEYWKPDAQIVIFNCDESDVQVPATYKLSATSYTYDGKAKKPTVTVTDTDGKIINPTNYTVTYANNVDPGTATMKITFKNLTLTKTLTFRITSAGTVIYRLYNPKTREHLWTANSNEYKTLPKYGWKQEGSAWQAPKGSTYAGKACQAVYRLYNPKTKDHHYTANANEAKVLTSQYGWTYDNNKKPVFYSGGNVPIYRLYNKSFKVGSHHLTKSKKEYDTLPQYGWKQEGVALKCVQ